jgi:hypothetical protein
VLSEQYETKLVSCTILTIADKTHLLIILRRVFCVCVLGNEELLLLASSMNFRYCSQYFSHSKRLKMSSSSGRDNREVKAFICLKS